MEWAELEHAVHVAMVDAVGERDLFAAALYFVYREQDAVIRFPLFGVVTRPEWEDLGEAQWNPHDWSDGDVPWLNDDEIARWERELEAAEVLGRQPSADSWTLSPGPV
ncbi:hypothetical protein [Kineosporia babensis]|uniref:Uncharacterized protein n=1 Tax=Kineosporia babensis TaxID=499548 RepID=A0A9X1NF28_9ACTN|nr:hypothetical protein [Kineosporia babensis]MCD5313937.1 hypothetical protein [Kineosporia babensis]